MCRHWRREVKSRYVIGVQFSYENWQILKVQLIESRVIQ